MRQGKPTVFSFFFHCSALVSFLFMTKLKNITACFPKKGVSLGLGTFGVLFMQSKQLGLVFFL